MDFALREKDKVGEEKARVMRGNEGMRGGDIPPPSAKLKGSGCNIQGHRQGRKEGRKRAF